MNIRILFHGKWYIVTIQRGPGLQLIAKVYGSL